jgi:GTP diphosphokinase / guanosine-3',5'-bis(diphosphate) 3'-diphosphatase
MAMADIRREGMSFATVYDAAAGLRDADLKVVLKALAFAAKKHRDHRRKDVNASPYINHPIAVADVLVNEAGVTDADVICAALLHDTIEDTDTTDRELTEAFGERVCRIVLEVTDDKMLPKQTRKRLQVENAAKSSARARLVKLADKICNLRDISASAPVNWSLQRQLEYFDWAREVVDRVRGTHAALEAAFDEVYSRRPR